MMFIELTGVERYRGQEHQPGAIIEVGEALGDSMVLNGHKKSNAEAFETQHIKKDKTSDDDVNKENDKPSDDNADEETDKPGQDKKGRSLKSFFTPGKAE